MFWGAQAVAVCRAAHQGQHLALAGLICCLITLLLLLPVAHVQIALGFGLLFTFAALCACCAKHWPWLPSHGHVLLSVSRHSTHAQGNAAGMFGRLSGQPGLPICNQQVRAYAGCCSCVDPLLLS
jgi:hypothetical protein